ncbi:MAG: hypothetical protein MUE40_16990, partial [Anaerolineae bacterium]|nr:hypothetical protein [Anaerolineae bacterium]
MINRFKKPLWWMIGLLVLVSSVLVQAQEAEFELAERIRAKVEAGETLNIYVSYQDVSNEFAPFIKRGVEQAAAELNVNAQFIGPVGSDADAQVAEIETLL